MTKAKMRDFEETTLWRISEFERIRAETGGSGYIGLERQTVLPSTLQAEFRQLEGRQETFDVVELLSACLRHREPALIYFHCEGLVWPVTLFPAEDMLHSPRDIVSAPDASLAALRTGSVEPPGVRPPGHWMTERIASRACYRPLRPALWALALRGPSTTLVRELGGVAAYRALRNPAAQGLPTPGALGPAVAQLHRDAAALKTLAQWPGMSLERGVRLLNGLYMTANLLVSRTHPNARRQPTARDFERGAG
jgi:hypothetical protein